MTDYFALLDEPRRPWLDPDAVKKKYLERSATTHPDRSQAASATERDAASRRYAELNAAYNCLRDPKERLRHLVELERGRKHADLQEIPADLAELFVEVACASREAHSFLADRARIQSALLRAQLFEQGQALAERLTAIQGGIARRRDELLSRLRSLDIAWATGSVPRARLLEELETIYRLLAFFARWTSQLQEQLVCLAL